MSRRPSHWPTKFSVNAAAFGSLSIRSTWPRSASGCAELPLLAPASSSSSSGIVLHRKYDSRLASAKSSSLPGFSRRNRNSGDTSTPLRPTRTACSNECLLGQLRLRRARRTAATSSSVTARRNARRAKSRRIRSASALGILRDDFHALAVVADRRRSPAADRRRCGDGSPAARRRAAALRPRPTATASPGPSYLSAPDLVHGLGRRQPVGQDADRCSRLEVIDELDDRRLVGRRVEVADEVALRRPSASARRRRER